MQRLNYILLILFSAISFSAFPQTTCREDLGKAIELYNAGLFEQTIQLLEDKMKSCKYRGSERTQAYKYLASAHYEIDNIEQADRLTYRFLKKEPLYEAQTTDPVLFSEALSKFERYPSLTIGFSAGKAILTPIILKRYTIWDKADYAQDYIIKNSNFFELDLGKNIFRFLYFNMGVSTAKYSYSRKIPFSDTTYLYFNELFSELKFPIELSSSIKLYKKFYVSIYAGVSYTRIRNLEAYFNQSILSNSMSEFLKVEYRTTNYRYTDNVGASFGLGIDYRHERFTFSLKMNNSINALPFAKKEIGTSSIYEFSSYYTDDLFHFKTRTYSFGLKYTFLYKIKEKY